MKLFYQILEMMLPDSYKEEVIGDLQENNYELKMKGDSYVKRHYTILKMGSEILIGILILEFLESFRRLTSKKLVSTKPNFNKRLKVKVSIAIQLLRQACNSFNLALITSILCIAISLIGSGLVLSGKTNEGTIAAVGGLAAGLGSILFTKKLKRKYEIAREKGREKLDNANLCSDIAAKVVTFLTATDVLDYILKPLTKRNVYSKSTAIIQVKLKKRDYSVATGFFSGNLKLYDTEEDWKAETFYFTSLQGMSINPRSGTTVLSQK